MTSVDIAEVTKRPLDLKAKPQGSEPNQVKVVTVWNNKGGVGKSTLAFQLACHYADKNPGTNVLVVDMCPQSNVSAMLLKHKFCVLESLQNELKTVVGLLTRAMRGAANLKPADVMIKLSSDGDPAHAYRHQKCIPDNMFLVCGDLALNNLTAVLEKKAADRPEILGLPPKETYADWMRVMRYLRTFLEDLKDWGDRDWAVFVDTNPAFTAYTQIAITAGDYLLIPVMADESSRAGMENLISLVYKPDHELENKYMFMKETFVRLAELTELQLPEIKAVVGNRNMVRRQDVEGKVTCKEARAFRVMTAATLHVPAQLYSEERTRPSYLMRFARPCGGQNDEGEAPHENQELNLSNLSQGEAGEALPDVADAVTQREAILEFQKKYYMYMRDFKTAGIASASAGIPICTLKENLPVTIHGEQIVVNNETLKNARKNMSNLLRLFFSDLFHQPQTEDASTADEEEAPALPNDDEIQMAIVEIVQATLEEFGRVTFNDVKAGLRQRFPGLDVDARRKEFKRWTEAMLREMAV